LMDKLQATRTFKITRVTTNPHEARDEIVAATARVGIVIPPDYHDKASRGLPTKVLVLIDGSDSIASSQALGAANGIAAQVTLEKISRASGPVAQPGLSVQPIILFNPDGRSANYIIP